jgi:two-component system sensor histidine kinase MprB
VYYVQIVTPAGDVIGLEDAPSLTFRIPESAGDDPVLFDQTVDGTHYRVYHETIGGFALTLALPLSDVDASLRTLAILLLILSGGGVALAVVLGGGVTAAAASPVARLTDATERVTRTGDLSLRIDEPSDDEIGRLASSFNAMLGALERSVGAQRQLVADASHELRTPITSIRTNVDLLASGVRLEPAEREELLADVRTQLEELTTIVNDLVELARDGGQPPNFTDVRLDEVVDAAVEAFRPYARDVTISTHLRPSVVLGDASRIARAVRNLLDNAVKWSPAGGENDVTARDGVVTVRDRGAGFPAEDLPHVFDRFYRSPGARSTPGSGLGLAIVRQVAESHRGRVSADNAEEGGALVRMELRPAVAADEPLPPPP